MIKTIFYSVGDFIALAFWRLEVYASQYFNILFRGCTVFFVGWLSYLKKLWQGYLDRQHYRKEVQRRLLRQRSYKKERQPESGHWTDRLLKTKALSGFTLVLFSFGPNGYRFVFPLLLLFGLLVYLPFVGHAAIRQELAQVSDSIQPLKVGDVVPDFPLQNIINYKSTSAKLSDFKGKLVIIDSWATWCGSCLSKLASDEALQQEFSDRLVFLLVDSDTSLDNKAKVESFLQKWQQEKGVKITSPILVNDQLLVQYFPRKVIPHYVWIDESGRVRAITHMQEVTRENVIKALKGIYHMPLKTN